MAEEDTVNIFDLSDEFDIGPAPVPTVGDPRAYFEDLLVTEDDVPLTPTLSDEEIERLYAPRDFGDQRKLALAQFGFGLLRPTEDGRIGASLAEAGSGLAANLAKINQAQAADAMANRKGILTSQMQQRAAILAQQKQISDINRGVKSQIATALYNKAITTDAATMKAYTDAFKAAKLKQIDYNIDQRTPKKGQFRLPDGQGGYGEPFVGYTIQTDTGPLFYRPTSEMDTETGLPKMQLIENPAGIQEMSTSMSGTPGDYKMRGTSQALDIKSQLDTYDKNIMYLSDLRQSIGSNNMRAGFLAGLKLKGQDFATIVVDALGATSNDFFKEGNKTLGIEKNAKFQPISATIDAYLASEEVQKQLQAGVVTQEDIDNLRNIQQTFTEIAAEGKGQQDADFTGPGGNIVYGQEAYFGDGFRPIFENAQQQDAIMTRLQWFDKELPLNQARANAIIYAIARARKSSGRLNLDDIERAAQDLNLFGFTSAASVITKLEFLENDLRMARNAAYNSLAVIPGFEKVFENMKNLGYGEIDFDRLRKSATADTVGAVPEINFNFTVQEDGTLTQTQ